VSTSGHDRRTQAEAFARCRALLSDYDDTLANDGTIDDRTMAALRRFVDGGRKLVLVTGRELPDLRRICPDLSPFARVVAENGAVLHEPSSGNTLSLGSRPAASFIHELRARDVTPLHVGEVIVATRTPHAETVRQVIAAQSSALHVVLNKDSLMVLPAGIDKGTGALAALRELDVDSRDAIAVGDAENDLVLLRACGFGVAVANAVPALRACADAIMQASKGLGVTELIDAISESSGSRGASSS
jgi:hydroxymethylpyrimidine pyrophosphatase-like HAD family hydrolase